MCRTKEKGVSAIQAIKESCPDAAVDLAVCDLSSMSSIQKFLDELSRRHPKLDILFNNAAVMKKNRKVTEDGFEMMFQVNYLAPFILMNQLLGVLRNGSNPCIVNNTSPADKYRLHFDDLQFEKNYHVYDSFMETKLCLLFAGLELARRPESEGITVAMIVPGVFKSDLVREAPFRGWMKNLISAPAERAADNILYHLASDQLEEKHGRVFIERGEKELTEYWKDARIGERLWSVTESMIHGRILQRDGIKDESRSLR